MGARHKNVMLYAKMWQWRFINKYKKLLEKTAEMLRKIEWKKDAWICQIEIEKKIAFYCSENTISPKTTQIWQPNLPLFKGHKWLHRCGRTHLSGKNSILMSTVFDPPGCFCIQARCTASGAHCIQSWQRRKLRGQEGGGAIRRGREKRGVAHASKSRDPHPECREKTFLTGCAHKGLFWIRSCHFRGH